MTAEDLEKMNRKLMRENENYVNAYRALQKDVHERGIACQDRSHRPHERGQ